ncbi:MAG: hypothetical protein HQ553_17040 [Chloroflexi bacterium]|nr:hypothetical protein [Chloroflexota bacterium]
MTKILGYKVPILVLIFSMLTSVLACGGGGSSSPTSDEQQVTPTVTGGGLETVRAKQITAIGQSNTEDNRKPAIEVVVRHGFTLGMIDENGNQLNSNIPVDSLSLTPEDVAAHAAMIPGGNYRTVNYVVDSLAEEGVVLASTDETITLDDFLPDLQDYVDWSFANPNDPKSGLGLLIGSGHEFQVPESAPTISGETMISPLASLMMMGDILLGIEELMPQEGDGIISKIISIFADDAHASDELEKPKDIKGLITNIKPRLGALLKLLPSDEWEKRAKQLLSTLEFNNRFVVRVMDQESINLQEKEFLDWTRVLQIHRVGYQHKFAAILALPSEKSINAVEVMKGVPAIFTFTLISPGSQIGLTLFPDADAQLMAVKDFKDETTIGFEGYRATVASKMQASRSTLAFGSIEATRLPSEARTALLLASATIETRLDEVGFLKQTALTAVLGMSIDEINALVKIIKPAPWICAVVLESLEGLECGKVPFSKAAGGGISWEGCKLDGLNHGLCKYYYEDGSLHSEGYYDKGEMDGIHTSYYKSGAKNCEGNYINDELEWEKCYYIEGTLWSEIQYWDSNGSGKTYYRSGRTSAECGYSDSGGECLSYCDNDAKTLCGENTFDEYGDDIKVKDDCDTVCQPQ